MDVLGDKMVPMPQIPEGLASLPRCSIRVHPCHPWLGNPGHKRGWTTDLTDGHGSEARELSADGGDEETDARDQTVAVTLPWGPRWHRLEGRAPRVRNSAGWHGRTRETRPSEAAADACGLRQGQCRDAPNACCVIRAICPICGYNSLLRLQTSERSNATAFATALRAATPR